MRQMLIGLIVIGLISGGRAQKLPTLDDPLGAFRLPNSLPPCGIDSAVWKLRRHAKILIGLEMTSDCVGGPGPRLPRLETDENSAHLAGLTVRQALDHLMTLTPTYSWKEMHGVAVVRPATAWKDPSDALNLRTAPFAVTNEGLESALRAMLNAMILNSPIPSRAGPESDRLIGRPLSFTFPGGTMLDALNAVIRAHKDAGWNVGLLIHPSSSGDDPAPTVAISVGTLDTSTAAMGTPLYLLQGRK